MAKILGCISSLEIAAKVKWGVPVTLPLASTSRALCPRWGNVAPFPRICSLTTPYPQTQLKSHIYRPHCESVILSVFFSGFTVGNSILDCSDDSYWVWQWESRGRAWVFREGEMRWSGRNQEDWHSIQHFWVMKHPAMICYSASSVGSSVGFSGLALVVNFIRKMSWAGRPKRFLVACLKVGPLYLFFRYPGG